MKTLNYKKVIIALMASIALTGVASAQLIISDPLNSASSGVSLDGRTPAQDGGTGTTAWSAPAGTWDTNGAYSATNSEPATIAFNLSSAEDTTPGAYTLSANVAPSPTSDNGFILSFQEPNASIFNVDLVGIRIDGTSLLYSNPAVGGGWSTASTSFTSGDLLSVVITATSGTSGGTASFYDNATLLGTSTVSPALEEGLTNVGLLTGLFGTGAGTLANFQLNGPAAVPEPSAYVLMLGGLVGLVAWMRLRRA